MKQRTGRQERSVMIQLRDALTAFKSLDLNNTEVVLQHSLKIADLHNQAFGIKEAEIIVTPQLPPVPENDGERQLRRVFFRVPSLETRRAKRILQKAFALDYLPNAQKVAGGELVQIGIPYVAFTACDKLAQRFPDVFQLATTERLPKHFGEIVKNDTHVHVS